MSKMFNGTVYKSTNINTGKCYICQTTQRFKKRKGDHISHVRRGTQSHFYNSIRKYGKQNFTWEILETGISHRNKLDWCEIFYISYYDAQEPNGYNIEPGGGKVYMTVRKIIKSQKGHKHHNFGKKASDKTKKLMSISHLGKNNGMFGKKRPDLVLRNKLNKGNYIGKKNPNSRAVIIEGIYFDYMGRVARELNIHKDTVHNRIKSKSERFKNWNYADKKKEKQIKLK